MRSLRKIVKIVENTFLIIIGILALWCIIFLCTVSNTSIIDKIIGIFGHTFAYYLSIVSFKSHSEGINNVINKME